MGFRHVQCIVFILNLLFLSGFVIPAYQALKIISAELARLIFSASATSLASIQIYAVNINEEVQNSTLQERMLLPIPELKPLTAMPQDDIVTPIPTVPAINPSNPTVSTTPTYNPIPTESNPTTPMITPSTMNPTNPYRTPSMEIPSSSSGLSWCIASQSASQTSLQVALDYACGYGGADCSQIQPSGRLKER